MQSQSLFNEKKLVGWWDDVKKGEKIPEKEASNDITTNFRQNKIYFTSNKQHI